MILERIPEPSLEPPEPKPVACCDECGDVLLEGDELWRIHDKVYCAACIEFFREVAE